MWPHGGSTAARIPPTKGQTWTLNDLKTLDAFEMRLNVWMSGKIFTKYVKKSGNHDKKQAPALLPYGDVSSGLDDWSDSW